MGACILIYMLYIPNIDEAIRTLLNRQEITDRNAEHWSKLRATRVSKGPGHTTLMPVAYYDRQIALAYGKREGYAAALNVLYALKAAQEPAE